MKITHQRIMTWAAPAIALSLSAASVLAQSPYDVGATKVSTDMSGPISKAGILVGIASAGLKYIVGHNGTHESLGRLFIGGTLLGFGTATAAWLFG